MPPQEHPNQPVECEATLRTMKTVLYFLPQFCDSNLRQLAGVYGFARKAGWNVQVVEYRAKTAEEDKPDINSLRSFWHPNGCIVDCGGTVGKLSKADFGKIPAVFIDRRPSPVEKGVVCVNSDSASIAKAAARELLPCGFDSYAYVDWFIPHAWSTERGDEFAKIVMADGKQFFRHRMLNPGEDAYQSDLTTWLSTLPLPCGVFAANDRAAGCVISVALKAGLDIPHDLPVVGCDNDVMQCENAPVTITSVPLDRERGGCVAAELLEAWMGGRKYRTGGSFGALPIVRRASSRRFVDHRVFTAVEMIRVHACEQIRVDDVVRAMGCSRSLAYLRFGEVVGHSILDEIHHVRIERAKELLKSDTPVVMVSDVCGYASVVDFRRTFKRLTGKTPRAWRKEET